MSLLKILLITLLGCNVIFFKSFASSKTAYINNLEWPPFFFPERTQGEIGLGKELIELCLNQTDYQPVYKTLPIKRTHLYMETGEIDISVYSFNEKRNDIVYFAQVPLFVSTYVLASKKENNLSIKSLDDLNGLVIGHLSGLAHTPELLKIIEDKKQSNQVSIGYNVEAMFNQLLASPQRFDIMPNSKETLLWNAKNLGITDKITLHDLVIREKKYYITVSKFSKNITEPRKFLQQLDNCLLTLKATGHYQKIAKKYGLD